MAGKPIDWPPDEELFATAEQVTSCAQIAKAHGIKPNTLTMRMHNDADFKAEINRRLRVTPLETPGEEPDAPEVLKSARLAEENRVLRADIKKLQKRLGHEGEFFDRIVEATRVSATKPRYAVKRQRDKKPANSVITPCYDQQFGQFVRPTDTPGNQGGFSVEVFDTRLKRWVEGVCGIIGKRAEGYRLQELFIPFGGDQVEGDEIFGGQAWQARAGPRPPGLGAGREDGLCGSSDRQVRQGGGGHPQDRLLRRHRKPRQGRRQAGRGATGDLLMGLALPKDPLRSPPSRADRPVRHRAGRVAVLPRRGP